MHTDHDTHPHHTNKLSRGWHRARATYRFANILSHHVIGAVFKTTALVYFVFCVLFLILRFGIMPRIDAYKSDVELLASDMLGRRVTISAIASDWEGIRPRLTMRDIRINDEFGVPALRLPQVSATLSWWSVPLGKLRLNALEIRDPDLDIRRDSGGHIFVAGIPIDKNKSDDNRGADWLLSQNDIAIRGGHIRWTDDLRKAEPLELSKVDVLVRNRWQHHQFGLHAIPPASLASPIDIRADFTHPHFARHVSDVKQWTGKLYLDVANTEFTAWKAYIDYPFEVQQGQGAARVWLDFDQASLVTMTADLGVKNVALRLGKDLQVLALDYLSGRIMVHEDPEKSAISGTPVLARGHSVELTNIALRTAEGLELAPTTVSESFVPGNGSSFPTTVFKAGSLDLQTLATLAERLPLASDQRKILEDLSPRGHLQDFSATWQGNYPDLETYNLSGKFNGLALKAQPARAGRPRQGKIPARAPTPPIPGFQNLTGDIKANDNGGSIHLASDGLKLALDGYFAEPELGFDKLDVDASWSIQNKEQITFDVHSMSFKMDGVVASLSGTHVMPLNDTHGSLGKIDVQAHIDAFEFERIGRFLPIQTPDHLRIWLTGGLRSGKVEDVAIKVKGDVKDFPFHTNSPAEKPKGEFTVNGKIVDGVLNYSPEFFAKDGRSPAWPLCEKIQGTIVFDRTRMDIHADKAQTHGVELLDVRAVIPDLAMHDSSLLIDGTAQGSLAELVAYTNDSPVSDMISQFTEKTKANGNAKLSLKLDIPLNHSVDTKVQGALQFANNDVQLFQDLPPLAATTGKLEFSEHGFGLTSIKANMLGGQVAVSGGMRDNIVQVKAEGVLTADGVRRYYSMPEVQGILSHLNGTTHYAINVGVRKRRLDVSFDSNLQGLGLDFPLPLRKQNTEILPLHVDVAGASITEGPVARETIRMSLGSAIAAQYEREKPNEKNALWHVARGGIGINVPPPQPDSGVTLNVNMRDLNIDAWRAIIETTDAGTTPKSTTASSGSTGIAQFFDPDVMAANAKEVLLFGKTWDKVVAGVSHNRSNWQANIDSQQVSGHVAWNDSSVGMGQYKVSARLSSMVIPKDAASDVGEILEGKSSTTELPALDIVADNFELKGKKLGRLDLQANNAQTPQGREWRISKLFITNPDVEFKSSGQWLVRNGENSTGLSYDLDIKDAGKLLERFGYVGVLRGGKGSLKGELSWKGLPIEMDIPSLTGKMSLDLQRGQFLKTENVAAAKLLGVLSLQSLPRRLTFDFRDVFSEGFAFDGVTLNGVLNKGVLRTDNLKMRGLAATVLMDGTADIGKETTNLHLVIIPEANAGAASVVYGLAVNPVIGLGSFLAQLFLREPLMRALTSEYTVTGPWQDPVVAKINHSASDPGKVPAASNDRKNDAS